MSINFLAGMPLTNLYQLTEDPYVELNALPDHLFGSRQFFGGDVGNSTSHQEHEPSEAFFGREIGKSFIEAVIGIFGMCLDVTVQKGGVIRTTLSISCCREILSAMFIAQSPAKQKKPAGVPDGCTRIAVRGAALTSFPSGESAIRF